MMSPSGFVRFLGQEILGNLPPTSYVLFEVGILLAFLYKSAKETDIVALPSAAVVMAASYSLRAALIRNRFRATSSTAAVVEGSSGACPSSSRRNILLVTTTALVRASSVLTVTNSSWRGIPSILQKT